MQRLTIVLRQGGNCCSWSHRNLSTVHRGVAFEQRALKLLRDHFSMSLTRVGGRGDGGIDLLGWWWLPEPTQPHQYHSPFPSQTPSSSTSSNTHSFGGKTRRIRVVGQCKAEKKKMGPNYVRELEGVVYRLLSASPPPFLGAASPLPSSSSSSSSASSSASSLVEQVDDTTPFSPSDPPVAILVSQSPFTKSTILRAQSSPIPFLLLHLPAPPPPGPDPNPSPSTSSQLGNDTESLSCLSTSSEPGAVPGTVATALFNMALGGTQGLLQGELEVRWERDVLGGAGRPGLWWRGAKMPSCVPDAC